MCCLVWLQPLRLGAEKWHQSGSLCHFYVSEQEKVSTFAGRLMLSYTETEPPAFRERTRLNQQTLTFKSNSLCEECPFFLNSDSGTTRVPDLISFFFFFFFFPPLSL